MQRSRKQIVVAGAAILVCLVGRADAQTPTHPRIQEAIEKYASADFQGVLSVLDAAEGASDLSPDDLGLLFELRALVSFGMGDPEAMDTALQRLAATRPTHAMTDMSPPAITERFAALQSEVAAPTVRLEAADGEVRAVVEGDPLGVVRSVRLRVRQVGAELWEDIEAPSAPIDGPTEVKALLIGPGGAVIVDIPVQSFGVVDDAGRSPRVPPALKWGLIAGAAAIVVIVVTTVLARRLGDSFIQPSAPTCNAPSCPL